MDSEHIEPKTELERLIKTIRPIFVRDAVSPLNKMEYASFLLKGNSIDPSNSPPKQSSNTKPLKKVSLAAWKSGKNITASCLDELSNLPLRESSSLPINNTFSKKDEEKEFSASPNLMKTASLSSKKLNNINNQQNLTSITGENSAKNPYFSLKAKCASRLNVERLNRAKNIDDEVLNAWRHCAETVLFFIILDFKEMRVTITPCSNTNNNRYKIVFECSYEGER